MDKNKIYKMVFEEIEESLDWGLGDKEGGYSHYIDGVIALANRMIEDLDKTSSETSEDTNKE